MNVQDEIDKAAEAAEVAATALPTADRFEGRLVELFGTPGRWNRVDGQWQWRPEPPELQEARHELIAALQLQAREYFAAMDAAAAEIVTEAAGSSDTAPTEASILAEAAEAARAEADAL